jgi:hypothetical protein
MRTALDVATDDVFAFVRWRCRRGARARIEAFYSGRNREQKPFQRDDALPP